MATSKPAPALNILVREPDGFSVWTGPPFGDGQPKIKLEKTPCNSAKFSEDGSRLMVIKANSIISIFDCKSYAELRSFEVQSLSAATLSPCGTYLQTFQRPTHPQEKNVTLWKIENGVAVYSHHQKNMSKATWPSLIFNSDESAACRLATNELHFFDPSDFSKGIVSRLRVPGVAAVELSKIAGSHVAVFVPESKGAPATAQIFACGSDVSSQPLARRSFFRCNTVQFHWNCGSTGLLVVAQADVDKTNQSYYGESKLCYLTTDGTHEALVDLRREGPVHEVQWSCSGTQFAVVYGFMPAMATIFDKKCNPILQLGSGPYNTIRWNPMGRFLCLAGFGNLPGDMAFWDYVEKKQVGTTKAEWSVSSEWSPDGCYFMTATTAPRLQVDNGIKIFHHNGSLYYKKMFDKLYQVDWKPESAEKFGDINELVKSMGSMNVAEPKAAGQGSKPNHSSAKTTASNPQKPAAYRPPHAKHAASVQAELFGGIQTQEMSKAALKNKKKREKQREKKAAEASASGDT